MEVKAKLCRLSVLNFSLANRGKIIWRSDMMRKKIIVSWFVALSWILVSEGAIPRHVYLTWEGDPSTTMTVIFQILGEPIEAEIRYDTESRRGEQRSYRYSSSAATSTIEGLFPERSIYWTNLVGLDADMSYYFVIGSEELGFSPEFKFRTVPSDDREIRFIVGGDMGVSDKTAQMLKVVGEMDPLFVIVGGDIAYANGRLSHYSRWDRWFDNWRLHCVTPEGYMVPMVLAIGNHEVMGGYGQSHEKAPFFFGYFRQKAEFNRSYFYQEFGKNVGIFILDSGHVANHGGEQADWLEKELSARGDVLHRIAVYHIPLYPASHRYEGRYHALGRQHWLPLFDRFGLTVAFENHGHVLKRTPRIRNGVVDPQGTLFLGDGCFGRRPHRLRARDYVAFSRRARHFWVVQASMEEIRFEAIGLNGDVLDWYAIPNKISGSMKPKS